MRGIMLAMALIAMVAATSARAESSYAGDVTFNGHAILISEQARDHIAGDGLMKILYQAASEPARDEDGDIIGWRLTDIETGSIYDVAGLRDGDIVTHIDDEALSDPHRAVELLRYVKGEPQFSYTVRRPVSWPGEAYLKLGQFSTIRYEVRVGG